MIGLIVTRGLDDPGNNEVFGVQCESGVVAQHLRSVSGARLLSAVRRPYYLLFIRPMQVSNCSHRYQVCNARLL